MWRTEPRRRTPQRRRPPVCRTSLLWPGASGGVDHSSDGSTPCNRSAAGCSQSQDQLTRNARDDPSPLLPRAQIMRKWCTRCGWNPIGVPRLRDATRMDLARGLLATSRCPSPCDSGSASRRWRWPARVTSKPPRLTAEGRTAGALRPCPAPHRGTSACRTSPAAAITIALTMSAKPCAVRHTRRASRISTAAAACYAPRTFASDLDRRQRSFSSAQRQSLAACERRIRAPLARRWRRRL